MDIRKSENVKESSQRSLIVSETIHEIRKCHKIANQILLSMQFPYEKRLITSRAASIFVCNIGRDNLFQCFPNLTKDFLLKTLIKQRILAV